MMAESPCAPAKIFSENAESKRIIAMQAWYTGGQTFKGDFANNQELIDWWRALPDDGALGFRAWYNQFKPVRTGLRSSGMPWYFLLDQDDPALDGDHDQQGIQHRYPNAILKRGKLVGVAEIDRVSQEMAVAKYWGD